MMEFQEAMLQELCSGIHILQGQDNDIVEEATDQFAGIQREKETIGKLISDNYPQIHAVKSSNQTIQNTVAGVTLRIDEFSNSMAGITTLLKSIPTKRQLSQHQDMMDDQLAQVEEIDTGLTTAIEAYMVSESTPFHIAHQSGPSGT
jgi:hypothetical protein